MTWREISESKDDENLVPQLIIIYIFIVYSSGVVNQNMEKDHAPDSMATVTIKPDYPPSEVYSTTSEPPPVSKY